MSTLFFSVSGGTSGTAWESPLGDCQREITLHGYHAEDTNAGQERFAVSLENLLHWTSPEKLARNQRSICPLVRASVLASEAGMEEESDNSGDFKDWLQKVLDAYQKLSEHQKNETLNSLVACSPSAQLRVMRSAVKKALRVDFITELPSEVCERILHMLDSPDLLRCRRVSKSWHHVIGSARGLWYKRAKAEGAKLGSRAEANSIPVEQLLQLYRTAAQQVMGLQRGLGVTDTVVDYNSCRCSGIDRVFYDKATDTVMTVSFESCVKVWSAQDQTLLAVVPTTNWISSLARVKDFIYTASFTGCIFQWEICYNRRQWRPCLGLSEAYDKFEGHGSPIMVITALEGAPACAAGGGGGGAMGGSGGSSLRVIATADRDNQVRLFYGGAHESMANLEMLTLGTMSTAAPPKDLKFVNWRSWEKDGQLVLVSMSNSECSIWAVSLSTWTVLYGKVLVPTAPNMIMMSVDILPSCRASCCPCPHLPRIAVSSKRILGLLTENSLDLQVFTADQADIIRDSWEPTQAYWNLFPRINAEVLAVGEAFLLALDMMRNDLLVYNIQKKATVASIPLKDHIYRKCMVPSKLGWLDGIDLDCPQQLISLVSWQRQMGL